MMPFYGDVEQFKRAVTSVLEQSDPDFRLVVVDDGYPVSYTHLTLPTIYSV